MESVARAFNEFGYSSSILVRGAKPKGYAVHHFILREVITEANTIATMITEAGETMPALLSLVWNLATANPLLTLITGTGIGMMGFKIFKRAKGAVK